MLLPFIELEGGLPELSFLLKSFWEPGEECTKYLTTFQIIWIIYLPPMSKKNYWLGGIKDKPLFLVVNYNYLNSIWLQITATG